MQITWSKPSLSSDTPERIDGVVVILPLEPYHVGLFDFLGGSLNSSISSDQSNWHFPLKCLRHRPHLSGFVSSSYNIQLDQLEKCTPLRQRFRPLLPSIALHICPNERITQRWTPLSVRAGMQWKGRLGLLNRCTASLTSVGGWKVSDYILASGAPKHATFCPLAISSACEDFLSQCNSGTPICATSTLSDKSSIIHTTMQATFTSGRMRES